MTDLILESNRSSVILKSLADAEVQDYSYEIAPSAPLLAKQYREIQANGTGATGVLGGQEISFNINKSMLLRDMYIKTSFSAASPYLARESYPGLRMFEYVQLKTNNKTIMTLSDCAIIARTDDSFESVKCGVYRRALPLMPTTEVPQATAQASTVTYTPIFCSFFEDTRNNFDLNFYEQLSLVCKFNTQARAGITPVVTLANCSLWVWTYRPDDKYYDMLRSKNQNPSKPLNMLSWNTMTERLPCTSATTTTIRLNTNYPVFKSVIMVNPIVASAVGVPHKIDSFSFSVGGVDMFGTVPYLVGQWEGRKFGSSSIKTVSAAGVLGVTPDDSSGIVLNWGLEPHNYVSNTGAVSFSQLNYPQVIVNHQPITAADYEVVVVHFYWNILTLDSTNGSVMVSVSS